MPVEESEGFDVPPSEESAEEHDDVGEEFARDVPPEVEGFTVESQLKSEIEQQLESSAVHEAIGAYEGIANIVGVGLGVADEDSSFVPGSPVVNVYVVEPTSVEEIRSVIVQSLGTHAASSEDVQLNVVVSGVFDAMPHRGRYRPAPGGSSVAHYKVTAGTLGCLARARNSTGGCYTTGDRRRRILILSNNHVLANSNDAKCLDPILQPGPYDGGKNPADRIAVLERWEALQFGAGKVNYVDCAVGWAWPNLVRKELINRTPAHLFRISSSTIGCQIGMQVGKSGRTTQCTVGRIIDCSWSGWVNYGGGRAAFFRDQFVVRGLGTTPFSAPGDSGSVIWRADSVRNPVGLLFAGGGGLTIANKIARVLNALDIVLYT